MSEVVKVQVVADTTTAKQQLQDLQTQLQHISAQPININNGSLVEANKMALELQQNLQKAMNPNTGKLDLRVFSQTLKASKRDLNDYAAALQRIGPEGQQAFLSLSRTIAMAEAPTSRLNASLIKFGNTIRNTINWQISSSLVHGIVGQFQSAINYAEKLNTSLNNIRIVTGASTDKMADFAREANAAAKRLSTTTTAYTNASLIYYQQGLGDKEVAARTETTLKLANVSRQSVEEVSNQMTAIWNNYAEGASNLEHYADVITALGAATASSSSEIATGLEKFAAIGKTVGLSYDYATTALATITAETRQSADTVGTGLRTLFSRLQGLKLGETLEDGVSLNKYSAALQTVGVNIQDQYGKVKDMDQILDELGTKWNTISKEQQIALAQTVGGVRQYTNLIALMDNWGTFQKNLKVAQGADGTLDKQAEIYGESWEAASKRVRTSIETIYDELLNDKAIIKLIDGFAGFLDIIHGITEGLGGMKGILLTVSSIFMSQYAKNIPGALKSIWGGFKQFTGIGMISTPNGRVDKNTYLMQQQNMGALQAKVNDTTASAGDRISARGSLTLAHMNQAYQARRRFMTADQQAAEELKIRNTEASFNSLEAQARAKEEYRSTAEDDLRKNLRKAQKEETAFDAFKRTPEEQAKLDQARDEAKAQAEKDQKEAESIADIAKKAEVNAQALRDSAIESRTEADEAQEKASDAKRKKESVEKDWEGKASGRNKTAAKQQAQAEADAAQAEAEAAQTKADAAQTKADAAQAEASQWDSEAKTAENKAKTSAQAAEAAQKEAAKTPRELREEAAKKLFESTHEGEAYITEEDVANKTATRAARQAQQEGLIDGLREMHTKEGLLKDTVTTAQQGAGRLDSDVSALDTMRRANWELTQKGKTKEQLDEEWAHLDEDKRRELGKLSSAQEDKALSRAKDKAQKYRENLEASIDAKYGKDSEQGKALKAKIQEAVGSGEDSEIKGAKSVGDVARAARAIAEAVTTAIKDGVKTDDGKAIIESEEQRQKNIQAMEDSVSAVTGLDIQDLQNFGTDVERGQEGNFGQEMAIQDLNNPAEGDEPPVEGDLFGQITTSIGDVVAATAACAGGLSAAANAFDVVADGSASFAEKAGAIAGALGSLKNVQGVAQNAAESIAGMVNKVAPPWIGAAVAAGTAIFGIIKGIQERKEAEAAADRKQRMEKAEAAKKETDQNKELIQTYQSSNQSLQKIIQSYSQGSASSKDVSEAQLDLIEKTKELNKTYKLSGTTAMILGKDLDGLNAEIEDARLDEIIRSEALAEDALAAATTELLKVGKTAKNTGVTENGHFESEWVDDGEYYEPGAEAPSTGGHYAQVYYRDNYSIDMGSKSDTSDEQNALRILSAVTSEGHGAITVAQDSNGQYTGATFSGTTYSDPEELIQVYEDLNAAYERMNSTMGEEERNDSEIYQNIKKQVELLKPAAALYQEYAGYIKDFDIEKIALGGAASNGVSIGKAREEITDLKTYMNYRQKLIDTAATAAGITENDKEQYEQLVNSVDAYLGTLSYVTDTQQGNLQIISQGLDDITEKQAKLQGKEDDKDWINNYKERLQALYEKYGTAIFELDSSVALEIPVDLTNTEGIEGRLKTQLDLLQEIAESNRIKVQLELAEGFNLNAGSSFTEWANFATAINANQKDALGNEIPDSSLWRSIMKEDFSIANFSALPQAKQQELISQYKEGLNDQYFAKGGQFEQEQAARIADREQARADMTAREKELDKKKSESNGNFSGERILEDRKLFQRRRELLEKQAAGELDSAGEEELNNINDEIQEGYGEETIPDDFVNEILDTADAADAAAASFGKADNAVQVGIATQEAYQQTGFRQALIDEANQYGINYDKVQAYATSLREAGVFEADEIQRSEEFALAVLKKNAAIEEINKNYSDWIKILNDPKLEKSEEGLAAVEAMTNAFAELLDLDPKQISKALIDWGKKAGNLQRLAQGNEAAWAEVFEIQTKGILENSKIASDAIEGLENDIKEMAKIAAKYNVGEVLSPEDAQKALDLLEKYKQAYKDAHGGEGPSEQEQLDFLETEANVDTSQLGIGENGGLTKTITFDVDLNDDDAQAQIDAFLAQNPELKGTFTITDADNIEVGSVPMKGDVNADGQVITSGDLVNAQSPVDGHIHFEGTAPTTEIVSKGGGGSGGGGGGGGGGGQKKKDHKKPDTGTRYHKIRAKQSNNNQNKQEISRQKDRAFGAEKIKQAEKEIELQKEAIELQRQYVDEINDYLAGDRVKMIEAFTPEKLGFDLGFNLQIDKDGVITNYRQLEERLLEEENKLIDKYNEGGLDDEAYNEAQKKIDEAREYLKIYEETRDLYEEEWIKLREYLDELADSALELTKLKIDLDISISDDALGLLDYMLEKIEDNAYKAAEAISLLGDKTNETLKRVDIYQSGLEEILNSKGLSLDDLANITDEQLINGDFTQAQIDQIREWRDAILDADKELLQMREDIIDKIIDAFNELNDKVQESYDQFDNYNSIIEDYTNITDLLAIRLNQQQKELIKMLGQAALNNAQTQAAAARNIYEEALANQQAAQKAYEQAVANGDTEAMRQWEKVVKETQTVLDDAQQQWLEAWQAALEKAQELYTKAIEDTVKAFEESVSGAFGALDYLQSAFDRMGQTNDQYLQDFEKLYELNKLNRDIQNAIDDTTNIRDKQALRDLQKEINRLQKEGVELSQYDVDALRKKFELEQARLALEDARNAKSEVRLQRDANGNWGYVYTAKEDEVAKAEQEYEDKLYEYQKLNDEYITELQSRVLETQTTYKDALAEIYNDTTLTDAQREARINELNNWLQAELSYFEQQLNNAMDNQQGTLDLYYNKYNDAQAKLADSWDETTLRMLIGAESITDYMDNVKKSVEDMLQSSSEALSQYNKDVDETNHMAGVETEDYGKEVSDAITTIGNNSAKTKEEIAKLSEELKDNFVDSLKEAINWEEEYANKINAAVDANESFIKSINEMIAKLAELESSNPGLEKARTAYKAAEMAHEEFVKEHGENTIDKEWEQAKGNWQSYLEDTFGIQIIQDEGKDQILGYELDDTDEKKIDAGNWVRTGKYETDAECHYPQYRNTVTGETQRGFGSLHDTGVNDNGNLYCSICGRFMGRERNGIQQLSLKTGGYIGHLSNISSAKTGMYTGSWDGADIEENGRLAFLHQKELVLNADDTQNFLDATKILRTIDLSTDMFSKGLGNIITPWISDMRQQDLEQNVHIEASFPNVTEHNEIERAFDNLINRAAQYVNRK